MYLHEMDLSKKIRLKEWEPSKKLKNYNGRFHNSYNLEICLTIKEMTSNDWEYFSEEKQKVKKTYYKYYYKRKIDTAIHESEWTRSGWVKYQCDGDPELILTETREFEIEE